MWKTSLPLRKLQASSSKECELLEILIYILRSQVYTHDYSDAEVEHTTLFKKILNYTRSWFKKNTYSQCVTKVQDNH